MKMMRWDPLRELESLSGRLNQLFGTTPVANGEPTFADWSPAVDIEETDKEYLMKADLPAVRMEDVKVGIDDGILSLEGERRQEREEKNKRFHKVERVYGKFVRRLAVPSDVDQQKVAADFKNGVLTVHLPKAAEARPKAIEVKVA